MKKILLFLLIISGLCSRAIVNAQSFSVQKDTVSINVPSPASIALADTIIPASSVTLNWNVVSCNFPNDWLIDTVFGLCDANACRQNTSGQLWNGTSGGSATSCTYPSPLGSHNFDLQLDLRNTISIGSYYVTVRFNDPSTIYSRTETFIVNRGTTGVTNINSGENDIILYPNPARDELNVVYNANADVKNIAVYNIIGKVVMVYKVIGDSANLNLENIPSGIYFVRLTNSHGEVVTTRKFTKQ